MINMYVYKCIKVLSLLGVDFINMDTIIVIMTKNKETGFLEKELSSITLDKNDEFILNLYACEEPNETFLHIKLTTDKDVENWEYNAILDYYDTQIFNDYVISISELEESYNPEWEVVIKYDSDEISLQEKISKLLEIHKKELYDVYEAIAGKESEYNE